MRRLPKVASEMALHVLAYNMKRVMQILGVGGLMAAMPAWGVGRAQISSSTLLRMSSKRAALDSRTFAAPIRQILARAIAPAIKSAIKYVLTQPGPNPAIDLVSVFMSVDGSQS
jgi:hypothetical protein